VVSFTLWLLYLQGKSPWYLLGRRLDRPNVEKKKMLLLSGLSNPSDVQPIASLSTDFVV
jgi:hypothetical protein